MNEQVSGHFSEPVHDHGEGQGSSRRLITNLCMITAGGGGVLVINKSDIQDFGGIQLGREWAG
ncbi:hypothetical protein Pmi06nite_48460 [Planotetraspora mira]|uniref:Uncharacterized protein n=1 Tax=Planotetraspora mira TaxID=58121 RepID=A0A8J3TSM1_9ACTN|nr:hypothetical protein Pmi06nite_48460 [Planotetraspora mira]